MFSKFFNEIRENLTSNEITQHVKHDLQKILAWFIIDYFVHNIALISLARKIFRPQNANDETILGEKTDYVWDPKWSHDSFINIPTEISSQAISLTSFDKVYIKVYPLTLDATPLYYNSSFPDKTRNNNLNSTFIQQGNLNGTRNLTQQDVEAPSHFVSEEIVETLTTTAQQSISPIHPNSSKNKKTNNNTNSHTIYSKTLCCSKILTNGLATFRLITKTSYKQRTSHRN